MQSMELERSARPGLNSIATKSTTAIRLIATSDSRWVAVCPPEFAYALEYRSLYNVDPVS